MIVFGIILLVFGFIAKIPILWAIGIILLVVGAVLWVLGSMAALLVAGDTSGSPMAAFVQRASAALPSAGSAAAPV